MPVAASLPLLKSQGFSLGFTIPRNLCQTFVCGPMAFLFVPGQVSYDDEHSKITTVLGGMIALKNERRKASEASFPPGARVWVSHLLGLGSAGPQCSEEQQRGNLSDPTAESSLPDHGDHPRGCSTAFP